MPSVQIHATKFEQLIARRGRDVKWQQSILCSCWNMDSGQPQYDCRACGGKGYTYEEPIVERSLVMSITATKEFEDMAGVFDVGDAVMTVPKRVYKVHKNPGNTSGVETLTYDHECPMYDVGMYDLVTLLDDDYKTSELLVRNTPMYERPADTLLNPDIVEIITIRVSDPVTGLVTKFAPGVDFTNVGNKIEWLTANQPSEGQRYSVTYKHRPVFTVLINLPKPRHQDGQDLPRYVALRYRAGGFEPK
jgi:hypothetical protein